MSEDSFVGLCAGVQKGSPLTCEIKVTGRGLSVCNGKDLILELPYQGLRIFLSGVNNRYLSFQQASNEAVLMVPDRNIAQKIIQSGAPGEVIRQLQQLRRSEVGNRARRWAILFAVLAAAFGIFLLGFLGLRIAERKIVSAIPVEWELEIGRDAGQKIVMENRFCEDPAIIRAISEMGGRLVSANGLSPYRFEVRVIATGDVNGFALPGGDIFLTQGLIEQAETGEEVAGVMAHEMQHVLFRHGLGNIARRAGYRILLSTFLGDMDGLEQFFAQSGAELMSLKFSREQEEEADRHALVLLGKAQIDGAGLSSFLERLAKQQNQRKLPKIFNILSTHPGAEKRTQYLRDIMSRNPARQIVPLEADWPAIKMGCSSPREKF